MNINLPLSLTLIRLILSPFILPLLIVYLLPYEHLLIKSFLAFLFIVFNLTDFFDGYLARKFKQVTRLGALLDPIADKALLFSVLIALVAVGKIYFYWAIVFIGREFFVMGLRLIALEERVSIKVSDLGKLKTVLLTAYITVVLMNPAKGTVQFSWWGICELILFALSISVSLWSAYQYFIEFKRRCFSEVTRCS